MNRRDDEYELMLTEVLVVGAALATAIVVAVFVFSGGG